MGPSNKYLNFLEFTYCGLPVIFPILSICKFVLNNKALFKIQFQTHSSNLKVITDINFLVIHYTT